MRGSRLRRLAKALTRAVVYSIAGILLLVGLALVLLETGWANNQIRALIIRQANQYLTATLDIGRLEGSLLRGVTLGDIRLSRGDQTIVGIDEVALSYSVRELFDAGTVIRSIRLTRPRVLAEREADDRWNLAALVRRDAREQRRTGPGRPIQILSIEIVDGTVALRDPLMFGAARLPTAFNALNASFSFAYEPVAWRLDFASASWVGLAPDLTVTRLSGGIANGSAGWSFTDLAVQTPRSAFTLDGRVARDVAPTILDLHVNAKRFAFQEWGGILQGLRNIAIDSAFDVRLNGPLTKLATELDLRSNGGDVRGAFVLDSRAPGWAGAGEVTVNRLNLAHWLNRTDRPSNISGRVGFDLDLELGRGFPRGSYTFDGSHAAFMNYEADNLRARGTLTPREALVAEATATAYGASLRIADGSIGIAAPYPFRFRGAADRLDLRRLPASIPVPHVESTLAFEYDVVGRFSAPFVRGRARFEPSTFLGAEVAAGSVGAIDTEARPYTYSGEGDLDHMDLHRFGAGLEVAWLQQPRYAGTVSGHFHVEGTGGGVAAMSLRGGGRLARAAVFGGELHDADVTIAIDRGSLDASYAGRLSRINPAIALDDARFDASLTGTGRGNVQVQDLLVRTPLLADYAIDTEITLDSSTIRGVPIDTGSTVAKLVDGSLAVEGLRVAGPALEGQGSGVIELDGVRSSTFEYDLARADLSLLREQIGRDLSGVIATKGQLTGTTERLRLIGDGTIDRLDVAGVKALATTGQYDLVIPTDQPARAAGRFTGHATFVEAFGRSLLQADGMVTYADERLDLDVKLSEQDGPSGSIAGAMIVHTEQRAIDLSQLTITLEGSSWRMVPATPPPTVSWDDAGVAVSPLAFVGGTDEGQRLAVSGTWRPAGGGALRITASHVFLDALSGAGEAPARYGGVIDLDATLTGTRDRPIITGRFTITEGRIRRLAYDRLSGRVDYADGLFQIDVRLDQGPGVWLTAIGSVPRGLFDRNVPELPMNVAIESSAISLGLIEGITEVIREVTGEVQLHVNVVGTSRDPHFAGSVELAGAGFVVAATGARYSNGRAVVQLATDRVTVPALHLEDRNGRSLDVSGSLATHELRVGDLAIDAVARGFEVLRNETGNVEVDAQLSIRGQFESPRITGDVTIARGELRADEILDRTLFQPYSTEAAVPASTVDAIAVLNPWQRLGLDIALHVPGTLRLTGDEVEVAQGTPLGLGSFNLRAIGDLYLYKDPGQPLYVTGSIDSLTGTYAFQGRRFEVDPTSSINFRADLNPELYVTVRRVISGVETRVTIAGPLREPELRLASTPPLPPSDILSLIVFNTNTNQLTAGERQDLAVRAGTLAAGFLTTPLLGALERSFGLDILEIEASSEAGGAAKVTIGDELAPGLVARFSRQFGREEYDEATIEYYLSRILRIRATFADAGSLVSRSPFRRVERAGVDLLIFFSF